MILKSFSGGQSKSKYHGIDGSWDELVGVNIHDTPGLLKCSQALKKDSGTTITERVDWIVPVPNGDAYFFSGESGKIWKRASNGTWSLANTNANGACLGAGYQNGYLLYASAAKLGRFDLNATWEDSWQDFINDDASYHPMSNAMLSCQIGDGKNLAQVDNLLTYSSDALDIRPELRISCLTEWLDDVIMGATSGSYRNKSQIIRWNAYDDSWNYSDPINETPNAFILSDNDLFFQAGSEGSVYYFNGEQGQHYGILRGETSIRPGATAEYKRRSLIGGVSGIWSLGRYDKDYPQVFSVEFVPSCGTGATIGAIASYGTNIFVAWKKSTDCGVDIIDTANKYSGYFTSMVIDTMRTVKKVAVKYNDLPTDTAITIYTKVNNGSWTAQTSITDATNRLVYFDGILVDVNTLQIKVVLTASGNSAPEIEALIVE